VSEKNLYADRDPDQLEPHYYRHIMAMTAEDLHRKSAIAAELAYRDQRIERLSELLDEGVRRVTLLLEVQEIVGNAPYTERAARRWVTNALAALEVPDVL
jgi:hypothetical protein